ncbi:MAG: ABC transporter substrate-binding protein [Egibacteraceae bacterium]
MAKRADQTGSSMLRKFQQSPSKLEVSGFVNVEEIAGTVFSTIYRAYEVRFERWVAIKVLPRPMGSMFERECRALGRLSDHRHVVRVFQAGVSRSGSPYIVMEYLPAGSLADRLHAGGPLPWPEVLEIGVKLAGVLQSAHEAGILHLDIKPANVLVGTDCEPKLADFGIAHLRAALGLSTQTLGFTPGYGAPELFEEGELAAACDVYGLGATLFALLKGHSPFLRSRDERLPSVEVIIGRQLFEQIPALDPGLPADVRAVVRRAMAASPQDRFSSAGEFAEALQAVQHSHELAVTTPIIIRVPPILAQNTDTSPARVPRWQLAVASLLLLLMPAADVARAVAGPEPCATVEADGVLSFGTLFPRPGQFRFQGPAMRAAARLAVDDVNAAGGIPGIAVQLDEADQLDEGDPSADTVRQSADELLAGDADAIIGPAMSASARMVIDTITCAGVIMFSPTNGAALFSTHPDRGLYFRTTPSNVFTQSLLAGLVVGDGSRTAVVISRDDPWATDLRELTAQAIEEAGVTVLDSFDYDPNALDVDREVQRIKAKNPDAIVLLGFIESAQILRAMIQQGLGPRDKRVYGASNVNKTLASTVDPRNPGVLTGMKSVFADDGDPAFTTRLRQARPELQDLRYGAETYDAVIVTALATAAARTDAPAAVAAQINDVTRGGVKCTGYAECLQLVRSDIDIDYDGVSGPLDFTDPGEPSIGTYVISEIQADGSLKVLSTRAVLHE